MTQVPQENPIAEHPQGHPITGDPRTKSISGDPKENPITEDPLRHFKTQHLKEPCSVEVQKQITSEVHLFVESIPGFMQVPEMKQKIHQLFFDFEIIAFELFALDTRFY